MRSISVRHFARMYNGLELLTHTNTTLQLGDLFDKRGMFNNVIDYAGYNIAYQIDLLPDEATALKDRLNQVPGYAGSFADLLIKDQFSSRGEAIIPSAQLNLTGKIELSKVKYFQIGKIVTKLLRDDLRYEVELLVEKYAQDHPQDYRKKLKSLFMVEQLFYGGEIKIGIEEGVTVNLESVFAETIGDLELGTDSEKNQTFTLKGSEYPFAVDLRRIAEFIG